MTSVPAYAGSALLGAALSAVLVLLLGGTGRGGPTPVRLALAGAVLASLLVALTSAVLVFDARTLDEFRFWIVGSIAGRDTSVALGVAPIVAAGLAIALGAGRGLNTLALGDEVARALGQRVGRVRLVAGVGFVLLAGARWPPRAPSPSSGSRSPTSRAGSWAPTTAGSSPTASSSARRGS